MAASLLVHPAFYRRVRHYRNRIGIHAGRPQVAIEFVRAVRELVPQLLQNPRRGHHAGFESSDLADILRVALPGFSIFALFYRWDGQTLTVITLEHTARGLALSIGWYSFLPLIYEEQLCVSILTRRGRWDVCLVAAVEGNLDRAHVWKRECVVVRIPYL